MSQEEMEPEAALRRNLELRMQEIDDLRRAANSARDLLIFVKDCEPQATGLSAECTDALQKHHAWVVRVAQFRLDQAHGDVARKIDEYHRIAKDLKS
jgi:hypothetical protein